MTLCGYVPRYGALLLVALGIVAATIVNVWLLAASAVAMPLAVDWSIIERAARLAGEPDLYDPRGAWTFVWSPVAAHALQFVSPLGLVGWRLLTVACALALPTWNARLLVLVSGPFWFDFANGNITTVILFLAVWALRGSFVATAGLMLFALLIPRPLMIPIMLWLLWDRPQWRIPFVAAFALHGLLVFATGQAWDWISAVITVGTELQTGLFNLSPTRLFGLWWLLLGIPVAVWLTHRGQLGLAGLSVSPYIWPYYVLFALPDVNRQVRGRPAKMPNS